MTHYIYLHPPAALQLNGTNARTHPVFTEITRVKQYNEKIKLAETAKTAPAKPAVSLDKAAANRFIAHGLAGNERYDREHAEQRARDNAALTKRKEYEANSESLGSMARFRNVGKKRKVDGEDEAEEEIVGEQKPGRQLELDAAEQGIARKVAKKQAREGRYGPPAQRQELERGEAGVGEKVAKKQSREVKKQKSHKAMRASGAVFQDLLNRPGAAATKKS